MPIGEPAEKSRVPAKRAVPKTSAAKVPASRTADREESLNGLGAMVSVALVMKNQLADAGAVATHGGKISHEVALIAEDNEQIAKVVDYLSEAGPYMGLMMAVLPLALQVAANHGKLDPAALPQGMGIVPPDLLEMQVRAEAEAHEKRLRAKADADG